MSFAVMSVLLVAKHIPIPTPIPTPIPILIPTPIPTPILILTPIPILRCYVSH